MSEHIIDFSFRGRYFKLGEIGPTTKHIWFVLHGYGQLAEYFIRKFNTIAKQSDICVIAPEGLSRFYLEAQQHGVRKNNRVGASWMTRENRLTDIENYLRYLNAVYHNVVGNTQASVTILGFSQGSATATRWALDGQVNFSRLILWAGLFPPDMDIQKGIELLHDKKVHLVYGKNDPFLTDERFAEMKMLTEKLRVPINIQSFEGGHEIDEPTLFSLR